MSQRARFTFIPALIIAGLNFASLFIIGTCLGWSAGNGYVREGHYFLSNHGGYFEVARGVWLYSYYHGISVWATHGLVFILLAVFMNTGDMALEAV
jgi:hypothetical protein